MSRRRIALSAAVALALAVVAGVAWVMLGPSTAENAGLLAVAKVLKPETAPKAAVFLVSDAGGWSAADDRLGAHLVGQGALVVGVDLPKTLRKAEDADRDCVYLLGAFEDTSQAVQSEIGGASYRDPVIAGRGAGGGLALALVAQTPDATVGRTLAVDPTAGITLKRPLCTGAPAEPGPSGTTVYGLEDRDLPNPVTVVATPAADPAGADHAAALAAKGASIALEKASVTPEEALAAVLDRTLDDLERQQTSDLGDLPIAVLPATGQSATGQAETLAIVLSGDGGWRDIDKQIAEALARKGVPTIGLDSLRYFWSEKSPATIAADLTRIIDHYSAEFGTRKVALIGYSFGADVLPAAYARLDPEIRSRVSLMSLLAFSASASFRFQVSGLIGVGGGAPNHPTLPDLDRVPPAIVQCIFGEEDEDAVCGKLGPRPIEVIRTTGGHHFDGDYEALADRILARLQAAPTTDAARSQ